MNIFLAIVSLQIKEQFCQVLRAPTIEEKRLPTEKCRTHQCRLESFNVYLVEFLIQVRGRIKVF